MADQRQRTAAAWPPRARIGLTAPCAGRIEMDDATSSLHFHFLFFTVQAEAD